ncbi:MAG: hypothetical protein U5J97_07205 [Trueperaceae bacterium]|nr:hypothetical protein [Trueperaceae bacterium]
MATSDARAKLLLDEVARTWGTDPAAAEARLAGALEEASRFDPAERARLHARLGQLRIFLGRIDDAVGVLYEALGSWEDGYLELQLAAALVWRGDAEALAEGERRAGHASALARRHRDGPLQIGASCVRGEAALALGRPRDAVEAFGEALGVSEFSTSEAVSVVPLAGLALAHLGWRAPAKAAPLASRALGRAQRVRDPAGIARALLALGLAERDAARLVEAAKAADAAPHRPLALRARVRALQLSPAHEARSPTGTTLGELLGTARAMGLRADAASLERLRAG